MYLCEYWILQLTAANMGNHCCGPSSPCDKDEQKGLLNSSGSKTLASPSGSEAPSIGQMLGTENENAEHSEPAQVIVKQPQRNSESIEGPSQSSYGSVIPILHTNVSLASQASQSASPEASKESEKTDKLIDLEESENTGARDVMQTPTCEGTNALDSEKAPEEVVENIKDKVTDDLVKPGVPALNEDTNQVLEANTEVVVAEKAITELNPERVAGKMGTEKPEEVVTDKKAAAVYTEKKPTKEGTEKKPTKEGTEKKPTEEGTEKKPTKEGTEKKPTEEGTEKKPTKEGTEKKPTKEGTEKKPAEEGTENRPIEEGTEKKPEGVDTEKKPQDVDSEKKPVEVGTDNKSAEVDTKKSPAQEDKETESVEANTEKTDTKVDTKVVVDMNTNEEVVITPTDVSDEKGITQNKESTLNDSTLNRLLTPTDITQHDKADTSVTENASTEAQVCSAEPSGEVNDVEKPVSVQEVIEEHGGKPIDKQDKQENVDDFTVHSATQEHSELGSSPDMETKFTSQTTENGKVDDLKDEDASAPEMPQAAPLKTNEEPCGIDSEAQVSDLSPIITCTEGKAEPESSDVPEDKDKSTESTDMYEAADSLLNGLDATVEKPGSAEIHGDSTRVDEIKPDRQATEVSEAFQKEEQPKPSADGEREDEIVSTVQEGVDKTDVEGHKAQKGEIILSSSHAVEVALIPVREKEITEAEDEESEDLYRGADEIEEEQTKGKKTKPLLEFTIPGVEERSSLAPAVDILAYSEREWKGNTAKSTLIRKGYKEMTCSFSGLKRVRGDNYCALRATLYQVLATTTKTPAWLLEEDFTSLPEKLEAQQMNMISGWTFPSECWKAGEKEDSVEKLKHYLELLQERWRAAADSESVEEKQRVCECVFQGGEEEYGLLEVLKFLMLVRAVELYGNMEAGQDVPVFCWLLFARDTSSDLKTFFRNHLSQVGVTGGLEQVEMFLLGYALQHTIQAFRLYMTDTEEFLTYYPDDHKQDWPCISIVTEDDRHYNIPVRKPQNDDCTPPLPHLS